MKRVNSVIGHPKFYGLQLKTFNHVDHEINHCADSNAINVGGDQQSGPVAGIHGLSANDIYISTDHRHQVITEYGAGMITYDCNRPLIDIGSQEQATDALIATTGPCLMPDVALDGCCGLILYRPD